MFDACRPFGPFTISNFSTQVVDIGSNDLVWDPIHQVFYASVSGTSATYANTVVAIDPKTGANMRAQRKSHRAYALRVNLIPAAQICRRGCDI